MSMPTSPNDVRTLWISLDPDEADSERPFEVTRAERDYLDGVRVAIGAALADFPKKPGGHVPQALYRTYHAMVEAWDEADQLVEAWDGAA